MGTKSIKKNYIYNTVNKIFSLLTPLITTPYISRVLGVEQIGEYSFANSIVSYFTLFAMLGITLYGQREISYVQDDKEQRSAVFWNIKTFNFIMVLICSVVYVFLLWKMEFSTIYLILYLHILTVAADISWFYRGMEDFPKLVYRDIIVKILNIIFIFAFVKNKEDFYLYVAGMCIFSFASACVMWLGLKKYICRPKWNEIKPFKNIKEIILLFLPTVAVEIYTVLDKTMIGLYSMTSAENGYYEQGMKIVKMLLTLVTALGTTMIPRIGSLFATEQYKKVEEYMYRSYRFVWFLGVPLCLGLIAVADNFVLWFFGTGYEKVSDIIRVASILIIAIGISNVTGMQLLVPTKRQNKLTITLFIGAILNFGMNIILIPRFYAVGAAISSVVAESAIAVIQLILVRKEISIKKIFNSSIHYILAGGLMTLVVFIENYFLNSSPISLAVMVLSGASMYFGVVLLLHDDFFLNNCKTILKKIIKR